MENNMNSYFNHSTGARLDKAMLELEKEIENGYMLFFKTMEYLTSACPAQLLADTRTIFSLSKEFGVSPDEYTEFISVAKRLNLFAEDDGRIVINYNANLFHTNNPQKLGVRAKNG